jgi:4-amino-4-deoxy-L-arabinose transferase-like glycosyltransferase
VFVSGLVIAGWLALTAWPSRRLRREYSSIGFVLALLCLLPLAGATQISVAHAYGFWFGVMLLIAGVRDHFAFVSVFPPLEHQHE